MFTEYHTDEKLIYDLLMTITALMVRAEFCKKVESAGGLTLIKDVMGQFPSNEVCLMNFIIVTVFNQFNFRKLLNNALG